MRKEIDDIYKKEFELKEAEKDAIKNITEDLKLDATETLGVTTKDNEKSYKAPKRADLKITTITAESIEKTKEGKTYYEYIDPKIIRKGIEFYNNKHENAKVTESNFITKRNKKEEPNISGIKKNKEQFNEILNLLIENDDTWKAIAEANEKIATLWTKKLKDGTTAEYSEFFEKTEDRFWSVITSKKDVWTYLLTYLFAGSKNLSYTITENNLINGDTSSYTEKPETTTSTLTYIDENTDFTDKKINATGEAKNIEKVINMTNAPEKITVTRKDGTVVKGIKSTTYTDATDKTAITTYVLESDSKTRVDLNEWDSIAAVVETANTTTKTLNITAEYLKDGVLTGVSEKRIDEIMVSYADAPDNLLITPKWEKTAKKIQKWTVQIWWVDTPTYVYTDTPTKRVTINDGDKIEATTETTTEVAINTTWETIDTNLNDTKKSTEKINFEKTDYALDDKNTYQKEIIKLSELFTDKDNYKKLIADKITIEDIASVTNITHLKNMFTYRKLKSTNETENETFKLVKNFHYDKLTNIDPTKQTYEVTATEKDGIQITAKEGSTKKFTITIKNTDGKMSTWRKDETTV